MTTRLIGPELIAARTAKLRAHLADAPYDAVLALSAPNVDYASGYRSASAAVHGVSSVAAVLTGDDLQIAGAVADSAPAFDAGLAEDAYHAYGRFFFESEAGQAVPTRLVEQHPGQAAAVAAAIRAAGLEGATIALDEDSCSPALRQGLAELLPQVRFTDASAWLTSVRSRKLAGEVALLEKCARVTEQAILDGIAAARPGVTEAEIADVVAATMAGNGVAPRFVVVTAGERSALADTYATGNVLKAGDLLRFDVGGIHDGYWSDLGRTAVLGEPTARQSDYYAAILRGLDDELAAVRPGVRASELFDIAIRSVQDAGGPNPYRRQHCGHGIGLDVYEPPIVRPDEDVPLEAGMTFCLETPYYALGWGGMMIEDTIVVEEDGVRMLSDRGRDLQVVEL